MCTDNAWKDGVGCTLIAVVGGVGIDEDVRMTSEDGEVDEAAGLEVMKVVGVTNGVRAADGYAEVLIEVLEGRRIGGADKEDDDEEEADNDEEVDNNELCNEVDALMLKVRNYGYLISLGITV